MYFGAHLSSSGGIDKAVQRALDIGADAVQVFTQSPRMWRPTNHKPENIARFRELREQHLQGAVAHASYLINAASDNPELWEKSAAALAQTMDISARLGLDGVIFHPGSHKGAESGIGGCRDLIAKACLRALEAGAKAAAESGDGDGPWLLLENSAGQGGTVGRDIDELATLVRAADEHPRLGVCIDSCHWWVSGVDVRERAEVDARLDELEDAIGLDRLRAIHLNDAKAALGSNLDRHDNVGDGQIGAAGLTSFLTNPRFEGLGVYLEVPGDGDGPRAEDIAAARALIA
jgi:deoxyribonuclease-4